MRTRDEHLEWCKARAREYLDTGDVVNAIASMISDMDKHPETKVNQHLVMLGMLIAGNRDDREAKRFIEGFR